MLGSAGGVVGSVGGAFYRLRSLLFGGLQALAFEGERREIAGAVAQRAARSPLKFGDSRACLGHDALCFGPGVARGVDVVDELVRAARDALA